MYAVRTLMIIVLALTTATFAGCSSNVKSTGASPHDVDMSNEETPSTELGDRKKGNEGVVLVYDERMDVFVVSGREDCYYTAGQFFRKVQGAWEWSVCIDGPWRTVAHRNDLPPGLRKHKA